MVERLSPMGHMEQILLASDGSKYTSGARRVGIAMAQGTGAKLIPMMMVYVNPEYAALAPDAVHKAEQEAWWHLNSVVSRAEEVDVTCEPMVCNGEDPSEEIIEQGKDLKADLIVVGQQGRRGLARLMVGDATAKVIGNAPCPVMVVPKDGEMWEKRILVGVDGSRFSEQAAVAASNLSKVFDVPVTVVAAMVPSHSDSRHQEGREAVDKAVAALKEADVDVEGLVIDGETDEVILKVAEERDADLIVMGAYGRTGFGRTVLGSNTERVISKFTHVVLVVS